MWLSAEGRGSGAKASSAAAATCETFFSNPVWIASPFPVTEPFLKRGITEPTPTFSACFGKAFLTLHPTKYGEELVAKMDAVGAQAYLVNTGWNGTGKRISIKDTRAIIDRILDGSIEEAECHTLPIFNLQVPSSLPGVDPEILDPRDTYENADEWYEKASHLAELFIDNFEQFAVNDKGRGLVKAGPQLEPVAEQA